MKTKTNTSDIYFAAAMLALGAKIDSVDKSDPKHMKFLVVQTQTLYTFESVNIPGTENVVGGSVPLDFEYYETQWANGELMVNAVRYKDAIQRMKSIIHSS